MEQQAVLAGSISIPVLLTPARIEQMLTSRQEVQVMKFRTTCTDCVPNY
jgi:hypothetical protein